MTDIPFKLPLEIDEARPFVVCDAQHETVISVYGVVDLARTRVRRIRDAVNAHDRLIAIAKKYRTDCMASQTWAVQDGYDVIASSHDDDIREIDAALALAEKGKGR